MAPQNKRANVSKAAVPAKKAKVSEQPEDPVALQLAPIFAALSASEETANCCDILRAALPHCLAEVPGNRHGFQAKMLDLTVSALSGLEASSRTGLEEAEAQNEKCRSEAATGRADFEAAQTLAKAKKELSDAKGLEVEALVRDVEAAKLEVKDEVEKKDAFLANKAGLAAEQEAFQKVMDDLWQPLKTAELNGKMWRKRDKCCTELFEKLQPLELDGSLVEALMVALKLKVDQRSNFALKAFACAEEMYEKHKAQLVERIAGAEREAAACDQAISEAEAKLATVQAQYTEQDKECDELQNVWVELDTKAKEAETAVKGFDAEVEAALEEVESYKSELEAAIGVSASFAALIAAQPGQQMVVEEVEAPEAVGVASAMEAEPEAVPQVVAAA